MIEATSSELETYLANADWRSALSGANPHNCGSCLHCTIGETCRSAYHALLPDSFFRDPAALRDALNYAAGLRVSEHLWLDHLCHLQSTAPGVTAICVDGEWKRSGLEIGKHFFASDDTILAGNIDRYLDAQRAWFRDRINGGCTANIDPWVAGRRKEHARIVFTLLAAHGPKSAAQWGR